MNNQNGNYGGIPGSTPYYNMNLPSQNNGVVTTQQMQTPVSPLQQFSKLQSAVREESSGSNH